MIFGFNSDVTVGDSTYHVQSEVRSKDRRLQTQVFLRGRCLGTRSASCDNAESISEAEIQERLREQHRKVLEAIRAGALEHLSAETS